jgi:hypothetical protein
MRYDTKDMTAARALYERHTRNESTEEEVLAQYRDTIVAALGH